MLLDYPKRMMSGALMIIMTIIIVTVIARRVINAGSIEIEQIKVKTGIYNRDELFWKENSLSSERCGKCAHYHVGVQH